MMAVKPEIFKTSYEEGRRAYLKKLKETNNPYKKKTDAGRLAREEWYKGWYDEWRYQKYGPNDEEIIDVEQ